MTAYYIIVYVAFFYKNLCNKAKRFNETIADEDKDQRSANGIIQKSIYKSTTNNISSTKKNNGYIIQTIVSNSLFSLSFSSLIKESAISTIPFTIGSNIHSLPIRINMCVSIISRLPRCNYLSTNRHVSCITKFFTT